MKQSSEVFGNKVRVRVSGLLFKKNSILLIKHNIDGNILWAPPGGAVDFGESVHDTLIREFKEETSLNVNPQDFLFFTEFIEPPFHALELFFSIKSYSGNLIRGNDPELTQTEVIIDVDFFDKDQLKRLPKEQLHKVLKNCNNPIELLDKRGEIK